MNLKYVVKEARWQEVQTVWSYLYKNQENEHKSIITENMVFLLLDPSFIDNNKLFCGIWFFFH